MSRRRTNANSGGNYEPLDTEPDEYDQTDGFVDEQWVEEPKRKFPWRTIVFILFFFVAGAVSHYSLFLSNGSGH